MKNVNWDQFNNDGDILAYLQRLPRYQNNPLKSLFWRARFFLRVLYCRIFKVNKPILMVLVTNNTCNLKCRYCYGNYGERTHQDYSTKELLNLIDELKALGTLNLTLHGGESLLRKDMGEIFNYAKLKGFYITFNTNGYLVPKQIEAIKAVDSVTISLDGRAENNDYNRGKGCYQKVMNAIDAVVGNKLPCVLHATLTKNTVNDMEFLAELAQTKHCRLQYSIFYNTSELLEKCADIVMSGAEIRDTIRKILALKRQGYPIYYSDNVLTTAINWPVEYEKKMFLTKNDRDLLNGHNLIPCYHGHLKYQIDADGRVVTCWAHDDASAPNVKALGVKEAIRQCHERDECLHCSFLANNEHNALLALGVRNILNLARIHLVDSLKLGIKNSVSKKSLKEFESEDLESFEKPRKIM